TEARPVRNRLAAGSVRGFLRSSAQELVYGSHNTNRANRPRRISRLIRLREVGFRRCCEQIQSKLMILQSNPTRLEADTNQHRPEIAFSVIHFVVVDLEFRAKTKLECG